MNKLTLNPHNHYANNLKRSKVDHYLSFCRYLSQDDKTIFYKTIHSVHVDQPENENPATEESEADIEIRRRN